MSEARARSIDLGARALAEARRAPGEPRSRSRSAPDPPGRRSARGRAAAGGPGSRAPPRSSSCGVMSARTTMIRPSHRSRDGLRVGQRRGPPAYRGSRGRSARATSSTSSRMLGPSEQLGGVRGLAAHREHLEVHALHLEDRGVEADLVARAPRRARPRAAARATWWILGLRRSQSTSSTRRPRLIEVTIARLIAAVVLPSPESGLVIARVRIGRCAASASMRPRSERNCSAT